MTVAPTPYVSSVLAGAGVTVAAPAGPAVTLSRTRYPWLTLPDNWDAGWVAAKAASGGDLAQVSLFGDSISQGSVTSDWKTKSYFELLRANLLTRYSLSGDFFNPLYNATFQPAVGSMPFGAPPAGFGGFGDWGFIQVYLGTQAQLVANPFVFNSTNAPTPNFTDADIHLLNWNGGTVTYNVDGGSPVVLTTFNDGGAYISPFAIATQPFATHTLNFTAQSVDNAFGLAGISTFLSRTRGLFFARFAAAGWKASDWGLSPGTHPTDRILIQQGITRAPASTGYGPPTAPHLAIVELGINDMQSQVGLDRFEGCLRRFCQAFRRGRSNASILFIVASAPDGVNSDVTAGLFVDSQNWPLYVRRIYNVARAFGCGVLNAHAAWADQGVALGYQTTGQPHPNDAGNAWIATQLEAIL